MISCAEYLVGRDPGERTQSDLKRAVSTLYYALFYELASTCADYMVGLRDGLHNEDAWERCFRALEHTHSRKQCTSGAVRSLPDGIKIFADQFATMGAKRNDADYNPSGEVDESAFDVDFWGGQESYRKF